MGLGSAEEVLAGLAAEGRPLGTPAVAVSNAARPGERIVVGTLADLASRVRAAGLESPVTLVVGEVARRALEEQGQQEPGQVEAFERRVTDGRTAAEEVA